MSTPEQIAQNISIIYFVIYGFVFLIASIYSAYDVEHKHNLLFTTQQNKSNETKKDLDTAIELNEVQNIDIKQNEVSNALKENQSDENNHKPCTKRFVKFVKYWIQSLWVKKSVYISIIPHLFDQATDFGVIYTYYVILQNPDSYPTENNNVNMEALFLSSVFIIVLHKIISCAAIFALTRKCGDLFLQLLDLMMVKAIYLNYKYNLNEPGNAQRFLQILEATFESAPQIVLSMTFILKTQSGDTLIYISLISSIWTLVSRVKNDDKTLMKDTWKTLDFKYNACPPVNWRYLFRVILWRFLEITTRVFLICLMWIGLGGFAVIIIMLFELVCALILCFYGEGVIVLGNMMYYTVSAVHDAPKILLEIGAKYTTFLYLTIITVFAMVPFEAWKVPDFVERHRIVDDKLTFAMFVYTWIATVFWVAAYWIILQTGFAEDSFATRNLQKLLKAQKFEELVNLTGFGCSIVDRNVLRHFMGEILTYCSNDEVDDQYKIVLFIQLFETLNEKDAVDVVVKQGFEDKSCFELAVCHSAVLLRYLMVMGKELNIDYTESRNSKILDDAGMNKFITFINEHAKTKDAELVLLYRMTRDGETNVKKYYHRGATVTIVRVGTNVDNEYICGGYTSISWERSKPSKDGGYAHKSDPKAFLFTLKTNGQENRYVFRPSIISEAVSHIGPGIIWGKDDFRIYLTGKVSCAKEGIYKTGDMMTGTYDIIPMTEYEVWTVMVL
eukprot:58482_1